MMEATIYPASAGYFHSKELEADRLDFGKEDGDDYFFLKIPLNDGKGEIKVLLDNKEVEFLSNTMNFLVSSE